VPTTHTMIITQLRGLLRLTETEIQVAETRRAQARTEAVERELAQNAQNARSRARRIARALRAQGGVPDVVTSVVGRLGAVAKSNLEQAQPLSEALLGDLALEHQLQDRARLLKALATAAGDDDLVALADDLVEAHGATVEWLTVVLAEVALGGPAALRATPVQAAVGVGVGIASFPIRSVGRGVDAVVGRAGQVLDRVGDTAGDVGENVADGVSGLRDGVTDLRDSAVGGVGSAARRVRQERAPEADELPVDGYAGMTKPQAVAAVKRIERPEDLRTVIAFEEAHRNRADVVSAAQVQLSRIAKDVVLT
jgi:hypothetical protein